MQVRVVVCAAVALVCFSFLGVLGASTAHAVPLGSLSQVVVFGDSIVDSGNTQNALGGPGGTPCAFAAPPCDPAPASFGYFDGRFTNGPNAADFVNQAVSGGNSVATTEGGTNYSYGGARSVGGTLPDLSLQVGQFVLDVAGSADANALYVINIGGNDVRDQIQAVADGTATLTDQQVIDSVVAAITTGVSQLQSAGAQHILVNGVGDVGSIPETLGLGGGAPAHGRALSQDLSSQLFVALDPSVYSLDVIALFDAVQLDPTLYGLPAGIDVTGSCLTSGAPPACSNFAFFDPVHPSTELNAILADGMLLAIPEPGTALLFGLGLAGLSTRRRSCS